MTQGTPVGPAGDIACRAHLSANEKFEWMLADPDGFHEYAMADAENILRCDKQRWLQLRHKESRAAAAALKAQIMSWAPTAALLVVMVALALLLSFPA